jgi:hypothetical protein
MFHVEHAFRRGTELREVDCFMWNFLDCSWIDLAEVVPRGTLLCHRKAPFKGQNVQLVCDCMNFMKRDWGMILESRGEAHCSTWNVGDKNFQVNSSHV